MQEVADLLTNYGTSAIIIGLFIWDWVTNKKDMKETLITIKDSNENISKTLDLLQKSFDNQIQEFTRQSQKLDLLLESVFKNEKSME